MRSYVYKLLKEKIEGYILKCHREAVCLIVYTSLFILRNLHFLDLEVDLQIPLWLVYLNCWHLLSDSECMGPPQNIRAWIKFVAACSQARLVQMAYARSGNF